MGNMFVSVADDISTVHYNPAGIVDIGRSLGTTGVSGLAGTFYGFLGYANPLEDDSVLGVSVLYFNGGTINVVDDSMMNDIYNAQTDFLCTFCYGRRLPESSLALQCDRDAVQ